MRFLRLFCLGLLALAAGAQSIPRAVENRYNPLRTLRVEFQETVSYGGRIRRQERGTLYLLRPGKMRWEYTQPAGKLFVSDGKTFYLYSPHSNQVQRLKPRETEDLRAPLAFLLGRLDFSKEFGPVTVRTTPDEITLTALARSDREPFTEAVFTIVPRTWQIRSVAVTGLDGMLTEFLFGDEKVNPPLEARLFRFEPPAGAEVP